MSGSDEDTRLLSVAESISKGKPVDWDDIEEHTDDDSRPIVVELKVLEGLARVHEDTPKAWGPFTIVGEIARGAFGTVYMASDPSLDLTFALKVIRPRNPDLPLDPAKAVSEARLLAKISHPNVVRVLRADRIGNEVGVAMELVKGRTLDDLVQTESSFSPNEAALIGIDLCRALAAVHRAGALHGDIKAHNVMRGEGGRTVLMDFGAAKDLNAAPRQPGNDFAGTPLYMAPEVFAGHQRSKASDIYSLGVLLYYLVSGVLSGAGYDSHGSRATSPGAARAKTPARRSARPPRRVHPSRRTRARPTASRQIPERRRVRGCSRGHVAGPRALPQRSPWISWRIVAVGCFGDPRRRFGSGDLLSFEPEHSDRAAGNDSRLLRLH